MKRSSTQIEIITPGAITWLPWINTPGYNRVDGYPDFTGFDGASLEVRESAWQNFIDGEDELEIIPDPEPIQESVIPNWDGFNAYMLTDPIFKSYRDAVREIDGDLNAALFDAYGLVPTNGVAAFTLFWSVWIQVSQITAEDKSTIAGVASMFNLPTDFISTISQ